MNPFIRLASSLSLLATSLTVAYAVDAPAPTAAPTALTAAQIAERNEQARGGVAAWRSLQSLSLTGMLQAAVIAPDETLRQVDPKQAKILEAGKSKEELAPKAVMLPMRVERKRPLKQRVEVDLNGKTSVQVFDGQHGWKVRPYLGRHEVEPYTAVEKKTTLEQPPEFEPPLVNYKAKGTTLAVEGTEPVDGRPAYRLKLTLKSGVVQHVWVDAATFLDVRTSSPRRIGVADKQVVTSLRDYRTESGLAWPFLQETRIEGAKDAEVLKLDKVVINPKLDDSRFAKPQ